LVGGNVAELVIVVVGAKIVLVVVVVPIGCGVGAGVDPVAGDKKMDRTFLKLAALSLSPSTAPVLHGYDDKSNGYEISDEKKFKQRRR